MQNEGSSMRVIADSEELTNQLCKAIRKYKNIRFAVAWASANHDIFKLIIQDEHKNKILHSTVGLHFEQTHPTFI